MEDISINIQFYCKDAELNLSVKDDLSKQDGVLKNFGDIQITDGRLDTKPIFWDNIDFFISCNKKEFKKECKKELKEAGYDWKEYYNIIKSLLDKAKQVKKLSK